MYSTPPFSVVCVYPCPSTFAPNLSHETICHVFALIGLSTFTILPIVLNSKILVGTDVICSRSDVGYGTNPKSPLIELIVKSHGGQRVSKHANLWAKNVFDKWRIFHGVDTNKLIVNILEDKSSIKNLVDMLFSFVLQVAKQDDSLYPLTKF
jgi:hypothetical protein